MKKYNSPFITAMFWSVLAIFLFVIVFCLVSIPNSTNDTICFSEMKWFSSNDSPVELNNRSQILGITDNKSYSVYFIADKDEEDVSIAFKTNFSEVSVYKNGDLVYSTKEHSADESNGLFSFACNSPGVYIAGLKNISSGDKITLSVNTYYSDTVCGVSNVLYGSSYDIVSTLFKKDIIGMFLCIAVFAIGTLMFVFYFSFKKAVSLYGIKYAACFAFLVAFAAFSEWTTLSLMFTSGNKAFYILNSLSFAFMFLPIIMFVKEIVQFRTSVKCIQGTAIFHSLFILILTVCAAFNLFDLHKSEFIAQWGIAVQCAFIFIVLFVDVSKRNEKRNSDIYLPILYMVFIVCTIIGHILHDGMYISILFILSCLLFLILVLIINMHKVAVLLSLGKNVEEMGKTAYTDALTGVGNTAAFKKKLSHLEVVKLNYKSIAIMQFDINNLKTINDNLGHEQGDKLIKDGSGIIYNVFGKAGDVYRTGGDEFVAVICGDNAISLCYNAISAFERAIDEYNYDESHKFILQIAYGYEYYNNYDERRYMTLKEILKKADDNMYAKKSEMKSKVTKEQILKQEPLNLFNE